LRIEFPGAVYHITSRGNAKQSVFLNNSERINFLTLLYSNTKRFHWIYHAYCLMKNHYHLLIEIPEANLSAGMRQLNGKYIQLFNRTRNRVGHLFQGRFKAIFVEKEIYLLELCRYIVLNLLRAGLVFYPIERFAGSSALKKLSEGAENKKLRGKKIYSAHISYRYSLKEISAFLGIHYTTVSKILKNKNSREK